MSYGNRNGHTSLLFGKKILSWVPLSLLPFHFSFHPGVLLTHFLFTCQPTQPWNFHPHNFSEVTVTHTYIYYKICSSAQPPFSSHLARSRQKKWHKEPAPCGCPRRWRTYGTPSTADLNSSPPFKVFISNVISHPLTHALNRPVTKNGMFGSLSLDPSHIWSLGILTHMSNPASL